MKKSILALLVLIGVYGVGYKSKDFVQKRIYIPIRSHFQAKISEYVNIKCPKNAFAIAIFGQSNSANSVNSLTDNQIPSNLYQYDWRSGMCYEYKEPLIGATGKGGNAITYTASRLARENSMPIIIIPFGVDGSSSIDWAYGHLHYQHRSALASIKNAGFNPKIFLWHQGETDTGINSEEDLKRVPPFGAPKDLGLTGLTNETYKNALQKVVDETNKFFPNSYFGIALVSKCQSPLPSEPIREAQKQIATMNKKMFISADSDKIYSKETRYDNCHFSKEGARQLGNQYYLSISTIIKQKGE